MLRKIKTCFVYYFSGPNKIYTRDISTCLQVDHKVLPKCLYTYYILLMIRTTLISTTSLRRVHLDTEINVDENIADISGSFELRHFKIRFQAFM